MRQYPSRTPNRGTTIILDSLDQAIKIGRDKAEEFIKHFESLGKAKLKANYVKRDGDEVKTKSINAEALTEQWKRSLDRFDQCVQAIVKGDASQKEAISRMVEDLHDLALDLQPSLKANYAGFNRSDDGISVSPELLAAGEELCCFKRKEGAEAVKQGSGEGAYRIIINTDVSWWGSASDNAAVMGALIILLQQFKPVELWIQQGWLGSDGADGVTLFKLDFTGSFDPTQLAFWIGHHDKDACFSYIISRGLGRIGSGTATIAEIEADLYLRGDWLKLAGIEEDTFLNLLHTEKVDRMAKWISDTAMRLVFDQQPDGPTITG